VGGRRPRAAGAGRQRRPGARDPLSFPYLSADDVERRLSFAAAADALEAALRDGLDPDADLPRGAVPVGPGELLLMPSVVSGRAVVKLVTVGGDPRVQGVCVVFDADTLAPAAVIDGIGLTNLRTAAVSALAVRRLAVPDARRLLVFGRGPQARAHIAALRAERPIEHVDVVGREHGDVDALVAAADVIVCATTARAPLFDGTLVPDHATVVAIGSHEPEVRETDDALAGRATVVVESRTSALREAGDVIAPIRASALREEDLVTLSELVGGRAPAADRPRLFKSTGMSWEDGVVALALLEGSTTSI
jgi:ornithine cyclodeaminase